MSDRVTNSDLHAMLQDLKRDLAAVKTDVEGMQEQLAPIRRAWLDGRAGLKGAAWTLSGVAFVLGLWWSGMIQKLWQFLHTAPPPGAP
jgi:hypothetical protein